MTLFNRHEKCIGLTLFRMGQKNVEIWYCPAGYEIKPHSHDNEDIELMYLFGKSVFYRTTNASGSTWPTEYFAPKWWNIFKRFTVSAGTVHWFKVSTLPLVFINFATFKSGHKPTSASKDFYGKS